MTISFCGKISLMLNLKRYPQPLQSRVGRFRECRALAFLSSLFVSCIYSLVSSKDTVFSWTALLQSSGSLKSVASHDGFSALHLCMENFVVCNPVLPRVSQDLIESFKFADVSQVYRRVDITTGWWLVLP